MESFIDPSSLKEFEETYTRFTPIWKGADSAHDLYVAWKKAKDFTATSTRHQVTPVIVNTTYATELLDESCPLVFDPAVPTTSQMTTYSNYSNLDKPTTLDQREKLAIAISPHTNGADVPSPFKNILFWPGTPTKTKRKNKKSTVKLPSVISSKDWQVFEGKKREEKKLEEQKKIERKRQREEKKNNKVCKKKKTVKKKLVFDESEDWICKVCGQRYSAEIITQTRRRWIQCDECGHTYHYKCLPKKHLDIYGIEEDDEEDEVAFVCHKCTKDSDDEDLHLSSDDEEEEDNDILASLKLL
uniref:PHD-type domain-containing protein n=1 Tax=Graphocephala atropunctata TaxID=36148 RepID=A0A1B6L7P3_9HEMI